jgi:hypothetical protein
MSHKYVNIRGGLQGLRWIVYIAYALIVAGLALIVLDIFDGGPPRFIVGAILAALGIGAAVLSIRKPVDTE